MRVSQLPTPSRRGNFIDRRRFSTTKLTLDAKAVVKKVNDYVQLTRACWKQQVLEISPKSHDFQWAINMPQTRMWIEDKGYHLLCVEYDEPQDWLAGLSLTFYQWFQQLQRTEALEVIYCPAPTDAQELQSGTWKASLPRMLIAQILDRFPMYVSLIRDAVLSLYTDKAFEWQKSFCSEDCPWEQQWSLLSAVLHCLDKKVVLMFTNFSDKLYQDLETGLVYLNPERYANPPRSDFRKVLIIGAPKSKELCRNEGSNALTRLSGRIDEKAERECKCTITTRDFARC